MFDTVFASLPVLETERCLLRPVSLDDTADMFRLMSVPEVVRYIGRPQMTEMQQAVERIEMMLKRVQDQSGIAWMIVHRESNEVIGNCMFFQLLKQHFRAEIGYALFPAYWGQGIISEVLIRMIDFAFDEMCLHSIEAKIDPENTASRRVLEKRGFVQEGLFRDSFFNPRSQQFSDTAVLSLVKR